MVIRKHTGSCIFKIQRYPNEFNVAQTKLAEHFNIHLISFYKNNPLDIKLKHVLQLKNCSSLMASTYHRFPPFESHQRTGTSHQGHQAQACPATHRIRSSADDDFVPRWIRLRLPKTWHPPALWNNSALLLGQQCIKHMQCCARALSAYIWNSLTLISNPLEPDPTYKKNQL